MNILIIGNGFDLAHELPTKYWDFIQFVNIFQYSMKHNKEEVLRYSKNIKLNKDIEGYLISDKVFVSNKQSNIVKEFSRIVDNNIWIEYFKGIKDLKNKGWVDFEAEISYVIRSLDLLLKYNEYLIQKVVRGKDNPFYNFEILNKANEFLDWFSDKKIGYKSSTDFYGDVGTHIIKKLLSELNLLIRALEIYLGEFVGKVNVNFELEDIKNIEHLSLVLSFNYTKTYEFIYDKSKDVNEYDYIHGMIDINRSIKDNNMVLGIDEYLESDKKNKELRFIQFKKYFQRIYKKTGCKYKKYVEQIREESKKVSSKGPEINNIYIFGHSLDITDKDIIGELILMPNTVTRIFYYNDEAYSKQIANLVAIIGQDKLIDMVYGNNPKIIFQKQSDNKI